MDTGPKIGGRSFSLSISARKAATFSKTYFVIDGVFGVFMVGLQVAK